ncbi:MAG TPA: DUF3592 domain-containing protein [Ktedonobacteraceae bacterium]|nr:DUF3592 domain-containing protein [Ktedonobacteraceae bacterium]
MFPSLQLLIPGVAVLLLACAILFPMFRSMFATINVRRHGTSIAATVTKIDAELVVRIAREYNTSYFIYADWEDPRTHKVYHFKSKAGSARISFLHPPGSLIEVLIDPKNPRRYEVVLKFDEQGFI